MKSVHFLALFFLTLTYSSYVSARFMEVGDLYEERRVEKKVDPAPAPTPQKVASPSPLMKTLSNWVGDDNARKIQKTWTDLKSKWSSVWNDSDQKSKRGPASTSKSQAEIDKPKIDELTATMPVYRKPEAKPYKEQAESVRQQIKDHQVLSIVTPGRQGSGTTSIPFPKDKIPLLDIGVEPEISRNDFNMPKIKVSIEDYIMAQNLKGPEVGYEAEVKKMLQMQVATVKPPQGIDRKEWNLDKPVTREAIESSIPKIALTNDNIQEKPVDPMTRDELNLLAATMLFEKTDDRCPLVIGLASELMKAQRFQDEGNYFLGMCAHKGGLYSDAMAHLMPLIKKEHPLYASSAIEALTSKIPNEYVPALGTALFEIKNRNLIPSKSTDSVNYLIVKSAAHQGLNGRILNVAPQVSAESPHYPDTQFILGAAKYAKEGPAAARVVYENLRTFLEPKGGKYKHLMSLVNLNLGRINFQLGRYKEALADYRAVDKNHPTWVQAMVELGWTQLAMDDYAGAIGNMYSMHSPYFSLIYNPESYSVRALGYLQICQYGDAYRAITKLETMHRDWLDKIKVYQSTHKSAAAYYATVAKYLQRPSKEGLDGLPPQVIREMARRRNFLNAQDSINDKIDEKARYQQQAREIRQQISKVQWRLSRTREQLSKLNRDLAAAKTNKALVKFVPEWEGQKRLETRLAEGYEFQLALYKESLKNFQAFERVAKVRFNREDATLRHAASQALKVNMDDMVAQMKQLLENNELLRYEIFAGSGENIRYQVAGGSSETPNRIPANVKPKKILNWDFDGEYWEDEVGSYRSSLKNNCPKYNQAKSH